MDEQDNDKDQVAESMVRMALELNKVYPKFDHDQLRALVIAAEARMITWTQIADLLDAFLAINFALEESMQQRSNGQEPVIDPDAYRLTI